MITYSQRDMRRQLVSDQRLWGRVPGAAAALLWPLEVLLFGWQAGSLLALASVAVVAVLSVVAPPRLPINIYLTDLLERGIRLPLWLGWLILVWHLAVREPVFAILGAAIPGALAATGLSWLLSRILIAAGRLLAKRAAGSAGGA